jgi:DNA-binding GntR family transcriptional regulator
VTTGGGGGGFRRQLRDEVAAYVRERISAGETPPGTLVRLAPLAEALDVSATPVREALLLLAQEGWVVQEPNRGFRVAQQRRQDVADAYVVLRFLSGEVAARAAAKATRAHVEELRSIDRMLDELGDEAGEEAQRLNLRVHAAIAAIAESPRLSAFISQSSRFVPRHFWFRVPGWGPLNRTGHTPVIDAIVARDAEAARAAMEKHIGDAAELLFAHLDETGYWTDATAITVLPRSSTLEGDAA